MYNIIAILIVCALNIASSVALAQEFTFKPPASSSPSLPTKTRTYTAEDYANSSSRAYQEHQAQIAAIADQRAKEAQINKAAALAKQPQGTMGKTPTSQEEVIKAQQKTMTQETPAAAPKPVSTEVPPAPSPAVQPYTGFQSPPSTPSGGGSGSTTPRNNNQNSSGWGSSIKY